MKLQKNYMMAVSGVMMLLVSSVLSVPRTTKGYDSSLIMPTKPTASIQPVMTRIPVSGKLVARPWLATSSIAQAEVADTSDDLSIDASLGDENLSFERKKHRRTGSCCPTLVVISIIGVLVSRPSDGTGPPVIDLRATISGTDAVRGSLLYGLAWLAADADPLGAVRALGYDMDVSREHDRPCADGPPSKVCEERARRLATLLDATLALGNAEERMLFRQGAGALGVAPDCSVAVTRAATSEAADPPDLGIDASIGDAEVVLEKRLIKAGKDRTEYLVVRMNDVIIASSQGGKPEGIGLRAVMEGADAHPGSLRYALAWLAGFSDPLGAVRGLGYDIDVRNQHAHSCPGFTCEDAARRLATLIDSTLGLGDPGERALFRRDASAIGIAPDCSPQEP